MVCLYIYLSGWTKLLWARRLLDLVDFFTIEWAVMARTTSPTLPASSALAAEKQCRKAAVNCTSAPCTIELYVLIQYWLQSSVSRRLTATQQRFCLLDSVMSFVSHFFRLIKIENTIVWPCGIAGSHFLIQGKLFFVILSAFFFIFRLFWKQIELLCWVYLRLLWHFRRWATLYQFNLWLSTIVCLSEMLIIQMWRLTILLLLISLSTKFNFKRISVNAHSPGVGLRSRLLFAHDADLLIVELCCTGASQMWRFFVFNWLLWNVDASTKQDVLIHVLFNIHRWLDLLFECATVHVY